MGAQPYIRALSTLKEAKEEIRTTGTLSEASFAAVLSILRLRRPDKNEKNYDRLEEAEAEIRITGTLSPASSAAVLSIPGLMSRNDSPPEPKIDHKVLAFLDLDRMSIMARDCAEGWLSCGDEMRDDYYAGHALPPDPAMNKILRYENAAQKKFDWALQRLLESQERRRKAQAEVGV